MKKEKRGTQVVREGTAPTGSLTITCTTPTCTFPACRCGLQAPTRCS